MFNVPLVVLGATALFLAIHAIRLALPDDLDARIVTELSFVPGRLTFLLRPDAVLERIGAWLSSSDASELRDAEYARFFLGRHTPVLVTAFSFGLLHGSWTHVILNTVSLVAFGSPVARRIGTPRFLVLVILGSVSGALVHWLCFPFGFMPVVGASAGISAAMGAATRFAFQPRRRIMDEDGMLHDEPQPALALGALLRDRRALGFIVAWFVGNTLFGTLSVGPGLSDMPVAWQAHVGGFLFGLLSFRWLDPRVTPQPDIAPPPATSEAI